jgi:hypothetical protein
MTIKKTLRVCLTTLYFFYLLLGNAKVDISRKHKDRYPTEPAEQRYYDSGGGGGLGSITCAGARSAAGQNLLVKN